MAAAKTTTPKEEVKVSIPLKGVKAKLQTARVALQEKGLKKSGKNTFANFDFFQLVDFLPEAQKIFTKLGLTTNYTIMPRTIDYIERKEGETIIKEPIIKDIARLIIKDMESDETETYEMEAAPVQIGNNTKQNIYQAAGGRSTYYKRYLYRDALEIEESDESDTMLGAPEVNYQSVEEVAPQVVEVPQASTIQEEIVIQDNTTPVEEKPKTKAKSSDILSQESREEIMQIITAKNLQPFEVLSDYCSQNGIGAPNELKEKDKVDVINFINTL